MKRKSNFVKINAITVSIMLALPAAAHADIVMKNGSATAVNGVPVVNINGANANGISHNIYDKLNVGKEGLVFNNSQNGAATQLAGQIAGNNNLASGSAKVILNEVTSTNASTLNGMMEVAGDKAHLIIANPNGITCESCGVINTEKLTLTTGTPDMQNGELKGYSVNGGTININNKLKTDSPTAILARSVAVNGETRVSGQDLTIVTGTNYVNTNNEVTGSVAARGGRNTYSLDVSKLGGMYAGKITLISTENGVGVRNQGNIASASTIALNAKGRLINTNATMQAVGDIGVQVAGDIDNVTGKILTEKSISIDTNKNTIDNSRAGNILASGDVGISSGYFNNTNGKVSAGGTLGINTNKNTLTNYGKGKAVGISAGAVLLQTGHLNNSNGQIKAYYIGTQSDNVNNNNAIIDSYSDVVMASNGYIDNTGGLIRSGQGKVQIDSAKGTLWNNQTKTADYASEDTKGIIAGLGGIQIVTNYLDNVGQIISSGDVNILSNSHIHNGSGDILSTKNVAIKSNTLNNNSGSITSEEGNISLQTVTGALENYIGWVTSRDGAVSVQAQRVYNYGGFMAAGTDLSINTDTEVNNNEGFISAGKDVVIRAKNAVYNNNGNNFGRNFGQYLGMVGQLGGIVGQNITDISAQNIYTENSRIIANADMLKLTAVDTVSNYNGQLVGRGGADIKARTLTNHYGTIYSGKDITVDADYLNFSSSGNIIDNNAKGLIVADNNLNLNVNNSFTNYGWITAGNEATVTSKETVYNRNTIYSKNAVNVNAKAIYNYNDLVGDSTLTATATNTLYNSGNLYSAGVANIKANRVENMSSGVIGGRQGTDLVTSSQVNYGIIVGL
ncbi:filamentous hemagglutinin N-terminal domain-containing protein [Enterobacteriaceae bacterium 4M9]|nr:filamentous hemagglutinin N-terminal domain-containing protein [Enterobacteriaceae bacterium 4M9]